MTEDDGQLTVGFQSALAVSMRKQAEIDHERVANDVAKLREIHEAGGAVESLRDVKEALHCGQSRAELARAAYRESIGDTIASAA